VTAVIVSIVIGLVGFANSAYAVSYGVKGNAVAIEKLTERIETNAEDIEQLKEEDNKMKLETLKQLNLIRLSLTEIKVKMDIPILPETGTN
jgi:TolA-binding protein